MAEANQELVDLAKKIPLTQGLTHVQAAYLEIAQPDISSGIALCVQAAVQRIVVVPYFLSQGMHVQAHIPEQVEAGKQKYPKISFVLTKPVGSSPRMVDLVGALLGEVLNKTP